MTLRLFDTAEQRKRAFRPLMPGRVSMYVCGATVQAPPHVGHMRAGVAFDLLRRWLMSDGYKVTFVRNVTDIDDKILQRANQTGEPWWAIASAFERDFQDAFRTIGCVPPTIEPRATGHVPDMIALTQRLVASGVAYARSGSVYFSVAQAADYGGLSGQALDQLRSSSENADTGYATSAAPNGKKDRRDFALWKGAKPEEPATAAWQTPWGRARPAWHLECAAMSTRYLGEVFDIHGGGRDLIFPHHENERALSRAAGADFARYWLHNAWVTVRGEKMSKSLDNSLSVRELLTAWSPRHLRYWLVSGHYRSILEYSPEALADAAAASTRVETFLVTARERYPGTEHSGPHSDQSSASADTNSAWTPSARPSSEWTDRFAAALNDDLNTAQALAVVHDAVRIGNLGLRSGNGRQVQEALRAVTWMTDILGIATTSPQPARSGSHEGKEAGKLIGILVEQRDEARRRHDYERADRIRQALADVNVELVDTPAGSRWWQQ